MRHAVAGLLILISGLVLADDTADLSPKPRARVDTTEGSFVIEMDPERAPLSVENFIRYAREGFYEGLVFHRVVNGFVAQGGGFDTRHQLKPPTHQPVPNESGNGLSNLRGTVGMARESNPHSAAAQFFVNLVDNPNLDPLPTRWGYAVFGRIVQGMDTIDQIAHLPTGPSEFNDGLTEDVPMKPVIIKTVAILE